MNILVTGASRGIGKAITEKLFSLGGNLFITARNEELLKSVPANKYIICDLKKDTKPLEEFITAYKIDVLVNNAGEYIYNSLDKMSNNDITQICNTNLIAPIKLIRAALPHMKEKRWGRIINIGSISGVMGEANASLYSATKAGLLGLTKALALELAEYNITVNTINPGWVDTELGKNSIDDSEFTEDEIIQCVPQRRFVKPEEIAGLVNYLISEDAKGITGQGINICAGLSVGI